MSYGSINLKTAIAFFVLIFGLSLAVNAQERVAVAGGSPAMNYSRELLKREDVRNELGLDAKQRETLAKLLDTPFGHVVVKIVPVVEIRNISKLSDDERKKWESDMARRSAEQAQNQINQQRREVEEVLTLAQFSG